MPRQAWPKTEPKNPKTRIQPHPPKEKPLRDANHARAEVPTKGVCSVDFTSVLQLLHRLAADFVVGLGHHSARTTESANRYRKVSESGDRGFFVWS